MKYLALILITIISFSQNIEASDFEDRLAMLEKKVIVLDSLNRLMREALIASLSYATESQNEIVTKSFKIVNDSGKIIAIIGSNVNGGGTFLLKDSSETTICQLSESPIGGGKLELSSRLEGKSILLGTSDKLGSVLILSGKSENKESGTLKLTPGILRAFNKSGEEVGYFGNNTENDGIIILSDRYGTMSWTKIGKVK